MNTSNSQQTTSADPGSISDQREIVEFQEDVTVQSTSLPLPLLVSDELISANENRFHDIRNIVTRTVKLDTFTWSSTDTPNDDIATHDFPSAITSISSNIADKLKGFTYFRASVRVRILVNATRSQSGRLVAWFAPFSSAQKVGDRFDLNDHLSGKTAFPHVFLNAGVGNVGELIIPYVSYYSHYEVPNNLGDMGKLYITVLNKLRSGEASPTCSVSVFAQFMNPSIEIPTGLGLLTPAPFSKRAIGQYTTDESDKKSRSRVISSTLGALGAVAAASSPLPLIGPFMVPVSWVLTAASKIAHYAGFSKPLTKEGISALYQLPARGFTHADGLDQSVLLSTSLENQIVNRRDVFGSGHDEMDIKFISSHECFVQSTTWSVTTGSGVVLMSYPVTPLLCARAAAGSTVAEPTLLGFCASMFRQWRGSMKYKIQISKNVFHSGRLRIVFVPGADFDTNPNTIDFNQCYSRVVDLVNADTIEYTIPFVANTLWKQVALAYTDGVNMPTTNYSTGMVYVEIINALRAPDIASDVIDLNLYQSSDDVEFSIPDFTQFLPTALETGESRRRRAVGQITGWDQDPGFDTMMKVSNPLFTASNSTVDIVANSVGEQVNNLRFLTRRFSPSFIYHTINNQPVNLKAYSAYLGTVPPAASGFMPPIQYVSFIYRFFRGSRRFKTAVFSDSARTSEGTLAAITDPCTFDQVLPPTPTQGNAAASNFTNLLQTGARYLHAQSIALNNFIEVSLPYFSNTYVSLIRGIGATRTDLQDNQSVVDFRIDSHTDSDLVFMEAAGDDFDMGWLIGPPRIRPRVTDVGTGFLHFGTATLVEQTSFGTYNVYGVQVANPTIPLIDGTVSTFAFNPPAEFVTEFSGENGDANVLSAPRFSYNSSGTTVDIFGIIEASTVSGVFDAAATLTNVGLLDIVPFAYYSTPA